MQGRQRGLSAKTLRSHYDTADPHFLSVSLEEKEEVLRVEGSTQRCALPHFLEWETTIFR